MNKQRTMDEILYWRDLWYQARKNVGSPTKVRRLMNYPTVSANGNHMASNHWYTAYRRGDKPKDPNKQRMLKLLAGPHARTVLKIMELRYK